MPDAAATTTTTAAAASTPSPVVCPRCHHQFNPPGKGRRTCAACGVVIGGHHKWFLGPDGRPRHRNCSDPWSYLDAGGQDTRDAHNAGGASASSASAERTREAVTAITGGLF